MSSLFIEVVDDAIVIRDPSADFAVTYSRGLERGVLVADNSLRHDPSRAELDFLVAAWKAAYAEAKALGWLCRYK